MRFGVALMFGSILLGVCVGVITIYWVKLVNHDNTLTINVTIVSAYLTYFLAEYLRSIKTKKLTIYFLYS